MKNNETALKSTHSLEYYAAPFISCVLNFTQLKEPASNIIYRDLMAEIEYNIHNYVLISI